MVAYSFKKQFIKPIQVGLGIIEQKGENLLTFPKRQTIRAIGKRRHAREGEIIQLYYAMRTKQCTSIGVGRCVHSGPIRIYVEAEKIEEGDLPSIKSAVGLDKFAISDGFADWSEMRRFWKEEHGDLVRLGPFVGVVMKWEPIR